MLAVALFFLAQDAAGYGASIPTAALAHRSTLIRCARAEWGLDAPTATFAAQVHQESGWRTDAQSPVGAQGLAQFMPATARWLPEVAPQTGEPAPWNPGWSLRALAAYDKWLWDRVVAATACDRMALALSAYNGGLGWVRRDARLAESLGLDRARWWGQVETVNAGRASSAWTENRGYPRRILRTLEPRYTTSGWGLGVCP
ncbi:MAG: transglycosylase SLT domain-containing protein [Desulfovibrionaceae bacterium]